MIKNNANFVSTGKPKVGGAIFRAPIGSKLPTDATTALDAAFVCLGYCSEDGVENENAPDTDSIKAWGGDTVVYVNNGKEDNFTFTLIESIREDVLKAVYNSKNVTGTLETGLTVKATSEDQDAASWVFELILKNNYVKRIVVPSATITDMDSITYNDSDPIGYGITLSAIPVDGVTHYEYVKGGTANV